jgi:hypothetical protein
VGIRHLGTRLWELQRRGAFRRGTSNACRVRTYAKTSQVRSGVCVIYSPLKQPFSWYIRIWSNQKGTKWDKVESVPSRNHEVGPGSGSLVACSFMPYAQSLSDDWTLVHHVYGSSCLQSVTTLLHKALAITQILNLGFTQHYNWCTLVFAASVRRSVRRWRTSPIHSVAFLLGWDSLSPNFVCYFGGNYIRRVSRVYCTSSMAIACCKPACELQTYPNSCIYVEILWHICVGDDS